ncbi:MULTISPECIES: ABC transporter ATP-binding protein [Phyllobacterium]|uniref:ABC transporter ATP-binding protein n=1 Tax=Phyllobacterium sophorae TaxID=1520277 RepID=A0A2P7BI75_9HYPH|nr:MULTISPECIES: ABC transporter ATP-binding protein [Phyllobacterium]PSH66157.1 ABC transporter ATP-binding protein [Phyllobacterium sophorae]UXN64271.1 ABC transporter ATP-binding protein [Phyllobacterium sp. A18/5-2]
MDGTVASKPANAVLELNNICRRFGITEALRDVSLAIVPGEIICLVGQSGCGKSSLLRIIAGVDTPDSGVLLLKDEEIAGPSRFVEPEARNIGFVFQDYALFPHLTAEQNVLFGLKGLPKKEARERAAEMIDRVGLYPLMKRYPHMLSGGEQQRVALARALAPSPSILLMDEPFSSLDRGLREKVRDETLTLLRALGTTVIMVTHDPEEALSAGDRIVLMRKGQIVQTGTGYDLHDRPNCRYAADFFCAFNKVPGTYRNGRIETAIGEFSCEATLAEGSAAIAYIRPQAISVGQDKGHIPGRITGRLFLGEVEQLTVQVEGLSEPLLVRTMMRLPATTNTIWLTIRAESLLAFSAH